MAFPLLGTPKPQFLDSEGVPLVGGTLAVLEPTDDTNKASYPTADDADAATNANTNPITLDSRGEPATGLFGIDNQTYKLVLKDADSVEIWTVDDVKMPAGAQSFIGTLLWPQTTDEASAGVTPTDYSYEAGNVLRYGAVGDDSTDSTSAIQDAIDSAGAGGSVYVPIGVYKITSPLDISQDGVSLVGESRRRSIIKVYGDSYIIQNPNSATATVAHIRVQNLLLSTDGTSARALIYAKSMQFCIFRDLFLSGSGNVGNHGIQLLNEVGVTAGTHNEIHNVVIGSCGGAGVKIGNQANSTTVRNVRCQPPSGAFGIDIVPDSGSNVNNIRILDCALEFPGNVSTGIRIAGAATGAVDGVYILGCRFESLSKGTDIDPTNATNIFMPYTGNYFSSNTEDVDYNQIELTDGDTTPDLSGGVLGGDPIVFFTNNTGATTITAFDGGYEGQEAIILIRDDNTTINHGTGSGQINFAAEANTTFKTNDVLRLVKRNTGNWIEVGQVRRTATGAYTPTNVVTDRAYDADATTTAELADVLGTLIADLQTKNIIS